MVLWRSLCLPRWWPLPCWYRVLCGRTYRLFPWTQCEPCSMPGQRVLLLWRWTWSRAMVLHPQRIWIQDGGRTCGNTYGYVICDPHVHNIHKKSIFANLKKKCVLWIPSMLSHRSSVKGIIEPWISIFIPFLKTKPKDRPNWASLCKAAVECWSTLCTNIIESICVRCDSHSHQQADFILWLCAHSVHFSCQVMR